MEKLIELLNEYAHTYADHYDDTWEEIEIKFLYHADQCFTYEEEWKDDTLVDDVVISKRFGFIKRLVDNDKIDYKKIDRVNIDICDKVLMELAIQDNPIEFLISILK